jgi:hypothetical protein
MGRNHQFGCRQKGIASQIQGKSYQHSAKKNCAATARKGRKGEYKPSGAHPHSPSEQMVAYDSRKGHVQRIDPKGRKTPKLEKQCLQGQTDQDGRKGLAAKN